MRIGIDSWLAATHAPGAGRYARELVRALVALDDRPDLALFEVGPGLRLYAPVERGLQIGDPRVERLDRPTSRRLVALAGRFLGRGVDRLLGGVDLVHHVRPGALPVSSARETLALADAPLAARLAPEHAREIERMSAILTFSSDARRRVLATHAIEPERVHAVHVGAEHWRRALADLPAPDDPPRIVVLGAVRADRQPLAVLRAFERVLAGGLEAQLEFLAPDVPAGQPRDPGALELARALSSSPARAHVLWRDPRATPRGAEAADPRAFEDALPRRLGAGALLVHLVHDAGTPVTPLEALALDLPVVASRLPAFEEALGSAAILVDPAAAVREPQFLADRLVEGLATRTDAHAQARRRFVAREYTWERCARETWAAWRAVLGA